MKLPALSLFAIFLLLPSLSYASAIGSQSFQKPDFSDNETTQADIEMENALLGKPKLLPDSAFYFLKQIKEKIRLALTFNQQKKSALHVEMAKERLAEAKTLTERGKAKEAEKAINRYNSELKKLNSAEIETQKIHLDSAAQSILETAMEKAPEEAKEGLRIALNRTISKSPPERKHEPEEEDERNESQSIGRDETEDDDAEYSGPESWQEIEEKNETNPAREQEREHEEDEPRYAYEANETKSTNTSNSTRYPERENDSKDEEDGDIYKKGNATSPISNSTISRRSQDDDEED